MKETMETLKCKAVHVAAGAAQTARLVALISKKKFAILAEQDKIRRCYTQLGKVYYKDYVTDEEPDDAEYDPQLCFVILHEGQVIAVAQAWTSAYLKDLVVHPHHQGQGLGSALLSHVFEVFRQRHEACVDLKVMEHNHRARRLYEQHGMALIRREAL